MSRNLPIWRLIPPLAAAGEMQMAIDAWLLEQHRLGHHPPTLRFYQWMPVALSLGYHQRQYPAAWHQLTWQGEPIELVRRPSGGRAVLHQGDLTYAVITSGIPGSRMQAYRTLCQFLIQGWQSLGVELYYGTAERGYIHNPNCFGTATGADLITAEGVKLIGSAQLRRGEAILQHGAIRLTTDAELYQQVFQTPLPPLVLPSALSPSVLTPDQLRAEQLHTLMDVLSKSAAVCFGVQLVAQPLTETEWQSIQSILYSR